MTRRTSFICGGDGTTIVWFALVGETRSTSVGIVGSIRGGEGGASDGRGEEGGRAVLVSGEEDCVTRGCGGGGAEDGGPGSRDGLTQELICVGLFGGGPPSKISKSGASNRGGN